MLFQLPYSLGNALHLHPFSAIYKIAFIKSKLLIFTFPRCTGKYFSIRLYCSCDIFISLLYHIYNLVSTDSNYSAYSSICQQSSPQYCCVPDIAKRGGVAEILNSFCSCCVFGFVYCYKYFGNVFMYAEKCGIIHKLSALRLHGIIS